MKYIRTKDGIFTPEKYQVAKAFVGIFEEEQAKVMSAKKTDFNIIKQADTIEELCDCYVIKDRDERLPFVSNTDFDYSNNKDKNNFDVYGAIWVGVDLKSVAKMNDKGELELL